MSKHSSAGYIGALSIVVFSLASIFFADLHQNKAAYLTIILFSSFIIMLAWQLKSQSTHRTGFLFGHAISPLSSSNTYILRSTLFRYSVLLIPWLILSLLAQNYKHFTTQDVSFSVSVISTITWFIAAAGIPYIYITLKLRGHSKFEFNDYAILLLLTFRMLNYILKRKSFAHILYNKRTKKIILVWSVTFFFLPLMIHFYHLMFSAMHQNLLLLLNSNFFDKTWFSQYSLIYKVLFYLLFTVDTGIAIIAYSVSSRWLGNQVRSVDQTISGWLIALICYPPLSILAHQFIGYDHYITHQIIDSDVIQAFLWAMILMLFSIYVWATTALGFKFSNLCNRGIISSGPYKYIRHPAYTCKNIAWWLEATHVLSSLPASLSLLAWNIIYILRGITEERHLKKDPDYQAYCKQVKGRFFFK